MFIDTHCHLEMPPLTDDTVGVIKRAKEVGVEKIVTVGTNIESSKQAIALAKKYPEVSATVGMHPEYANKVDLSIYQQILSLAASPEIKAIGEIGLDYYRLEKSGKFSNLATRDEQIRLFEQMIDVAVENQKPIIIHSREAANDTLDIVNAYKKEIVSGVFHCFSYDLEISRLCLDTGFYLSFTNVLGYKKNDYLRKIVRYTPIERILIETDAPFLPPEERRGQHSEPADVLAVATQIAEIKKSTLESVAGIIYQNSVKLFNL